MLSVSLSIVCVILDPAELAEFEHKDEAFYFHELNSTKYLGHVQG